jgi:hypothetical protein
MGALTHGLRRSYQAPHCCRCVACRAANTRYSARYRSAIHAGRRPLGAHVVGTEARRLVAALVEDGFPKTAIATALGLTREGLPQFGHGVTVRTILRLRRLRRQWTT